MTRITPLSLLLLFGLTESARHVQATPTCAWPKETVATTLDPNQPSQQRHLDDDAERAEDLAIRYADTCCGPRSAHFEGMAEYGSVRDRCMATLFRAMGSGHGVTEDQVRRSLGHRRTSTDLAVVLSFVLLFGLGANFMARGIVRRYPADDEWIGPVVITAFTAIATGACGVLVGEAWSLILENIRLGNGHLSYRVNRVPWTQHHLGLFCGGTVLFGLIAGFHYYRASSPANTAEVSPTRNQ